jgi:hypothetical protein
MQALRHHDPLILQQPVSNHDHKLREHATKTGETRLTAYMARVMRNLIEKGKGAIYRDARPVDHALDTRHQQVRIRIYRISLGFDSPNSALFFLNYLHSLFPNSCELTSCSVILLASGEVSEARLLRDCVFTFQCVDGMVHTVPALLSISSFFFLILCFVTVRSI